MSGKEESDLCHKPNSIIVKRLPTNSDYVDLNFSLKILAECRND